MSSAANAINTNVSTLVVGPSSATDNAVVRFDGTGGKRIQDSSWLLTDAGTMLGISLIASDTVNAQSSLVSAGTLFIQGGVNSHQTITTTTPYDIPNSDYIVEVNVAGAATVTLPTPTLGRTTIIKDISGAASTNNITVTGSPKNIDGAANYVINTNYGSATFVYNGTEWNILSKGFQNPLSPKIGGTGVNNGASTLTLGGNLTTSGAFASTLTMTGATSVTLPTSGTLATTTQLAARYLELNQNSTQSITTNTITAVQFPNSVKNTFSSNLTISGTGNTTFTNASGADMYLNVAASVITDNSSAASTAGWLYILLSRGVGNNTTIFQTAQDGNFSKALGLSFSCPIFLANGDSFQIGFIANNTQLLGNSTSIQSTGQIFRTSLILLQVPTV